MQPFCIQLIQSGGRISQGLMLNASRRPGRRSGQDRAPLRRRSLPGVQGRYYSTYFRTINRNKKSLTVDINKPEGQEIVRRLAARSDLFLENTRPGFMEGLKLGYEQLRDINARLVYVSITGFSARMGRTAIARASTRSPRP